MTTAKKDTDGKPSLVDLFDLPADAPNSVWSEPEDAPHASADRAPSSLHAATVATATADEVVEEGATGAAPRIRLPIWLWISSGVLGALIVVVLTISFSFRDAPATTEEAAAIPAQPAEATPLDETTVTQAVTPRAPAVPTDHSALVAARAALRAAEADLTAGRHAGARARLGRLLLAIDAVEPRERDQIHAAAALLVARSLQADADAARSSKANAEPNRRASR